MLLTKARTSDAVNGREEKNRAIAYEAACESIVLLKNDKGLPFKGKLVALFGAGADHTVKGGTGSGEVNERKSVSIAEGLTERGFRITTKKWLKDYEADYTKAVEEYKKGKLKIDLKDPAGSLISMIAANFQPPSGRAVSSSDIADSATENCVYVISRQAGEGGDRRLEKGDYLLTDTELADIKLCARNYKHFVLVINAGSGIDMGFMDEVEDINAVLFISQLGCEGGHAVADILSGAVTPCGKLADTWAKHYDDLPYSREYSYLNGELKEEYYKEGIFVGYRYFDSFGIEPRYPFGFGLSYTEFRLGKAEMALGGTEVDIKLKVKNKGLRFAGKEVVQVYVSAPKGKLEKEYQRLAAYGKTPLLAPGKSAELALSFDMRELASFRFEDASFVLEKGDYLVRLGSSSRDTEVIGIIRLGREVILSKHKHVCPVINPFAELHGITAETEKPENVPILHLKAENFKTVVHRYPQPELPPRDSAARRFVDTLTLSEMAELVVGIGNEQPRFVLPGAVGNTSSKFWDRGLANVALCDGPAGLRILRRAGVNNGRVKPLEMVFSFYEKLPAFVKKRMVGDERKDTVVYQFATAFPVESALAQSWSTQLMEKVGAAIREEMREYGCTWWLAPAVNIHRNPLCGRNFEYLSEDPFLAGSMAAAMCKGVQAEPGFYATVKHFACNNQEDNRNRVNSNVSERALREIYLTPFRLCVEAGAKSIMTSYNRLNGTLTPTSYDLCTNILRNEWGFEGVVMTDWYSTLTVKDGAPLAISAGNDLLMPGEPGGISKKMLIKGVEKGITGLRELKLCCCRVVDAILQSDIQKEYITEETKQ